MVDRFNAEEIASAVVAQGGQTGAQGGWVWAPIYDPDCAEFNTFLTENNSISILPGSAEVALSGVRVILNNTFAPLPVIGHSYASAQFIGRGATEVSFRIASIGTRPLSRMQSMMEELQRNAREFRRIKKSSTVDLSQNEFLALFGIEDGIISGFDTETDQRGTNLYRGTLSLTSEGHHNEEFHQEAYMQSSHSREIIERLLEYITATERRRPIDESPGAPQQEAAGVLQTALQSAAGSIVRGAAGSASPVVAPIVERAVGRTYQVYRSAAGYLARVFFGDQDIVTGEAEGGLGIPEVSATALQGGTDSAIDAAVNIAQEVGTTLTDEQEGWGSATWDALSQGRLRGLPIVIDHNPRELVSATYTCRELRDNDRWLEPYLARLVLTLTGNPGGVGMNDTGVGRNLPLHSFFVGEHRGAYRDYGLQAATALRISQAETASEGQEMTNLASQGRPGRLVSFPEIFRGPDGEASVLCQKLYGDGIAFNNTDQITRYLNDFQGTLYSIAQSLLQTWAGTPEFEQMFPNLGRNAVYSQQMTLHPTYPDLDLPPHPTTGQVTDTEPDYYFFGDSEEGMLNEVGPEIANEMDDRILAMENSFTQLASGSTWESHYLGRSRTGAEPHPETGTITGRPQEIMDGTPGGMEIDPSLSAAEGVMRAIGGITGTDRASATEICMNMSTTILSGPHGTDQEDVTERRKDIFRNSVYSIPNTTEGLKIGPIDSALAREDRSHSFARTRIRELIEQSVVQNADKTLTMRRAFPSFKIYFIEDDIGAEREHLLPGGNVVMYFDDLYNYNSVKSIRLVRSRKNPSDLLVLELTNVKGLLERRQWVADPTRDSETYMPGFEETELENPLKKIILKEGLKVQARLGFTNDPAKMGIKFIGEIVEISFNAEAPDEMTIICQSYGAELMMDVKGGPPSGANFRDTPDVCHTIMCSPELVHFGRFDLNPEFNPAEARSIATSRGEERASGREMAQGIGLISNPQDILDVGREMLCRRRSKWILANNPADDNIYAPRVEDSLSEAQRWANTVGNNIMWTSGVLESLRPNISFTEQAVGNVVAGALTPMAPWANAVWTGINIRSATDGIRLAIARSVGDWLSTSNYTAPVNTIWEIFKEMELRHPGWVAQPRPYGTRMTMFFGQPSQRYWADQITQAELILLRQAGNQLDREYLRSEAGGLAIRNQAVAMRRTLIAGIATASTMVSGLFAVGTGNNSGPLTAVGTGLGAEAQGTTLGLYALPPFVRSGALWLQRQLRNIRVMSTVGDFLGRTFGRFRPFRRHHLITSEHNIILNNIRASEKGVFNAVNLQYAGGQLYSMKADDSIPDERTVTANFSYPACDNETLARRYCAGLLARHLKDIYKGEIVVAGMDIDPYDICFIADRRTGMYGGVEVEQVVDTFTQETGWITEITPDMIVGINEWATTSTQNAYFGMLSALYNRYMTSEAAENVAGAGAALLVVGNPIVGAPLTISLAAGAYLAYLGGYMITRWTQDRQPLWILPLILGDRPYFCGLDGFRQDGIFASIRGRLHDSVNAVTDGWRAFHLAGYLNDITVGLATNAARQAG